MFKKVYVDNIVIALGFENQKFTVIENPTCKKLHFRDERGKKCLGYWIYAINSSNEIKKFKRKALTIV